MTKTKKSSFPDRRDFHVDVRSLREGCLVRGVRSDGTRIHKAVVQSIVVRDGVIWATGQGWELPDTELEVIRAPVPVPEKWPVLHSGGVATRA